MEISFWKERWDKGEIGFHQEHINPYLGYFYGEKGPAHEARSKLRVFVPLCGKSRDLWWLMNNGYATVGVECSELAVEDFFNEHQIVYRRSELRSHVHYAADKLEILMGDFFSITREEDGKITDIFDRASLVALPEEMRRDYVEKMTELQDPGTRTLLITLTYPHGDMNGPPFSISEEEVEDLYGTHFSIDKLVAKNVIDDEPGLKSRGLTELTETAYKLTRK